MNRKFIQDLFLYDEVLNNIDINKAEIVFKKFDGSSDTAINFCNTDTYPVKSNQVFSYERAIKHGSTTSPTDSYNQFYTCKFYNPLNNFTVFNGPSVMTKANFDSHIFAYRNLTIPSSEYYLPNVTFINDNDEAMTITLNNSIHHKVLDVWVRPNHNDKNGIKSNNTFSSREFIRKYKVTKNRRFNHG